MARLAARRTPMAEAEKEIANYLTGTAEEKQEKAKLLFAGLLETLNTQRTQVMTGLERANRKQKEFAQTIREEVERSGNFKTRRLSISPRSKNSAARSNGGRASSMTGERR